MEARGCITISGSVWQSCVHVIFRIKSRARKDESCNCLGISVLKCPASISIVPVSLDPGARVRVCNCVMIFKRRSNSPTLAVTCTCMSIADA